MDPLSIVAYALQALDLVPKVISAGRDIAGYIATTSGVIKTAQDTQTTIPATAWNELKAMREELQGRLHAP